MNKTVQLKDKDKKDIYPKGARNEYPLGSALVTCVNHGGWSGNTSSHYYCFSAGSWKQYGPMAQTTSLHRAAITVPSGEIWTIKIDWIVGYVDMTTRDALVTMGIGKYDGTNWDNSSSSTNIKLAGSSGFKYVSGGDWPHSGLRGSCIDVNLTAGTYYYALWVFSDGTITIRGNETTTQPANDNWNNGPGMSYTIYLLDRRKA